MTAARTLLAADAKSKNAPAKRFTPIFIADAPSAIKPNVIDNPCSTRSRKLTCSPVAVASPVNDESTAKALVSDVPKISTIVLPKSNKVDTTSLIAS